jgi:hypothetical protein
MKKITLKDIYNEAMECTFEGINTTIFNWVKNGQLDEDIFNEYLEITQGDIIEAFEETFNEEE